MKKFLFAAFYFLSPFLLIATLYTANPAKYLDSSLFMTMVLASMAYTWLIWQFVLSSRPKFIEAAFGMDKLYRFHGLMAIVALVLAGIHGLVNESIFGESFMTTVGSIAIAIFISISVITLLLMVSSFITNIKPFRFFRKTVESWHVFKYEHYRLIHNLTIIALVILQIHVLFTSSAKRHPQVVAVFIAYFVIAVLFYSYHKFFKKWLLKNNYYVVSEVVQASSNMWDIHFVQENGHIMKYKPGQFGFFKISSDSLPFEEHPFTISSSAASHPYISITVKELGDFTKSIRQVKSGDRLFIEAPFGRFSYINYPQEKETVFIVGGVGITPAMSMLRHMREKDKNRKILLLWGMSTLNDFIFKEEFEAMLKEMPNLTVIPVVSQDLSYNGEKGYIDRPCIEKRMKDANLLSGSAGFYLCGPPILMSSSIKNLESLGISRKRIHYEKFSL